MIITPDPIFFERIIRGTGPKRKLINISNGSSEDWETKVTSIKKPDWIELEDLIEGHDILVPGRQRVGIIVNLDSSHQFFPMAQSLEEEVEITFEDETELAIPITIQEVIAEKVDYPGVFAMDFGTTNTCYAHKNKFDPTTDPAKASQPANSSIEIPSQIFFKDVSLGDQAKYSIGTDAAHDIREFSWQTYSYFLSIKRMLGSEKDVFVLDGDAGRTSAHRQQWSVSRIAGFIIKEILLRAEDQLGAQIQRVVATYPTLYSKQKCVALLAAYKEAFELMGREWNDDRVKLDLDEANAAAFNYIYGELLEVFKGFAAKEQRTCLISYDFGGGTVDVAFLDVTMTRDDRGRIKISTDLRGITGDLYFGGDNITLASFEMLKSDVVRLIAEERHVDATDVVEEVEVKSDDPFGDFGNIFDGGDDDLSADELAAKEKEKKDAEAAEQEQDEEPAEVQNREDPEEYQEAIEVVYKHREGLKISVQEGISLREALDRIADKAGDRKLDNTELTQLQDCMEMIIPTRWASYENVAPEKEDAAKKVFYELWHEADQMKIRLSSRGGEQRFEGLLKRVGEYANVEPKIFNDNLTIHYNQLERKVRPAVEKTIRQTHALYTKGVAERDDGLRDVPLKVLLAGNSSKLPLVRSMFCDVFEIGDDKLVFQADRLKTAVAQGACEKESLRRDLGEGGLIQWETVGAVDRLPFSIGLFSPDLKGLSQYQDGFIPIFTRGTSPGEDEATFVATHEEHFLVHSKMERLALYADYRDGKAPLYMGMFNFDGQIAPDHGEEDGPFQVTMELKTNRGVELRVPSTDTVFNFQVIDELVDPELNPFSGVH
jgi:molecular chaperone DnaK (HSP70)